MHLVRVQRLPFLYLVVTGCLAGLAYGQDTSPFKYNLHASFRDQNNVVLPGFAFKVDGESSRFTDINGELHVDLAEGTHILTVDAVPSNKFRAFIAISKGGLNPNHLEFIVDSEAISCPANGSSGVPKIIDTALPVYPPVALAVHAEGSVTLLIKVSEGGMVITATAVLGHPLLRKASEAAARKLAFEPAPGVIEREVQIVYVFMTDEYKKPDLKRYKCPYRILVVHPVEILNTTEY